MRAWRKSSLKTAAAHYKAILDRLWAGCGGGLITAVTALRYPANRFFWPCAISFALGVLLLGTGALLTLWRERKLLRALEETDDILEMRVDFVERPSAHAGLELEHPQTWTALGAAVLFLLGVVFAAALVVVATPL
jgi:hypothetical protein